ncbi:MAG: hypothetical protein GX887_08055 [Firmicutes bacterium]|nr:hypothetical protein [Bacillota bacterium]
MFHRATGIGSMPHLSADAAIGIIKENLHHIPHWPQLPRRDPAEGLIRQYLNPLMDAGLVSLKPGLIRTPFFEEENHRWDERVLRYYEMLVGIGEEQLFGEESPFAFARDAAEGFYRFLDEDWDLPCTEAVKGQLSSPVTVGLQVTDQGGSPAFYNDQLRELLVKTLTFHARWQLKQLGRFNRPVLLFIDDPGVYGYGTSGYVGLGREEIQKSLGEVINGIKMDGGLVGIHCCAGADWSLMFELPFDLVSFDAYNYFPSLLVYVEELSAYLDRGGGLAWGIVPTSERIDDEDAGSLYMNLKDKIEILVSHGIDREKLQKQLLLTPSCGTGTLTEEQAESVYRVLAQLVKMVMDDPSSLGNS